MIQPGQQFALELFHGSVFQKGGGTFRIPHGVGCIPLGMQRSVEKAYLPPTPPSPSSVFSNYAGFAVFFCFDGGFVPIMSNSEASTSYTSPLDLAHQVQQHRRFSWDF